MHPSFRFSRRSTTSSKSSQRLATFALIASLLPSTLAHTWLEEMQAIGPNGSYIGDLGYSRGYMARNDPGFNGYSTKWQLPSPDTDIGRVRINESMFACHPAQRTANYTEAYPQLNVAPGSYVAMKYLENGHVTQPWIPAGKPDQSGTVWVFGTYDPSPEEKLTDVLAWTSDSTGGNKKGWLMAAQAYDDGRCHQLNQAPISITRQISFPNRVSGQPASQIEQWCETDLYIPDDARVGSTLTTYWVWSWDTGMRTEGAFCGKDEYYTTCSDFQVIDGGDDLSKIAAMPMVHTLGQQDPQTQAVRDYKSRTALTATPTVITNQSCTYGPSDVTTSSWPASLTGMTTMPSNLPSSASPGPMPTYNAGAPHDGGRPSSNGSQQGGNGPRPGHGNAHPASSLGGSVATTSPSTPSSPAPASPTTQADVVSFITITVYTDSKTAMSSAASSTGTISAAMAVVSDGGVISEMDEKRVKRHPRHVWR
ncbi:hypothetical protein B0A48_00434 [Cryoendolithus antarcticus]|uniref:DUF7492 domain-containing protein n=1 Tax=Cryoendolithus antarcticus TaxID=1507870 RepID=A0A1V8TV41_9PEZI|nr:hypothetical protein B0A48_00434 [Cryoendolithus antarcticus]